MLIKKMYISHLMTHAQKIEEEKLRDKSSESKRARTCHGYFSHSRCGGHVHCQLLNNFSGQGSWKSQAPKFNKDRVSNPKSQGSGGNWYFIPTFQTQESLGTVHKISLVVRRVVTNSRIVFWKLAKEYILGKLSLVIIVRVILIIIFFMLFRLVTSWGFSC